MKEAIKSPTATKMALQTAMQKAASVTGFRAVLYCLRSGCGCLNPKQNLKP